MIQDKSVSVVVQGSICEYTKKCLESVRKYLPGAEIILSTWQGSDVSGLIYDKLVLSKDPGGVLFNTLDGKKNNINRIIISSQAGVQKATRKYTLLLRNDIVLVNNNVLKLKDNLPKRNEKYSLFKQRIFAYEMFSIKFEEADNRIYKSIFHISDWCRFGLTEDLKKLFDVTTVKEPNFSQYMKKHKVDRSNDIFLTRLWKMSPEQYIISENAKKVFPKLNVKNCLDWRDAVLDASDKFIINNFIVKSVPDWGMKTLKPEYKNKRIFNYAYCRRGKILGENQLVDYKKYCDPNFLMPLKYTYKDVLKIRNDSAHFRTHIKNVYLPVRLILRYVDNILACVFYGIKIVLKSIFHSMRWFIKMARTKVFVKFSPPPPHDDEIFCQYNIGQKVGVFHRPFLYLFAASTFNSNWK